jgi:hypothetical protein
MFHGAVKWSRLECAAGEDARSSAVDHNPAFEKHIGESETGHIRSERIDRAVTRAEGIDPTELNKREGRGSGGERVKRESGEQGTG